MSERSYHGATSRSPNFNRKLWKVSLNGFHNGRRKKWYGQARFIPSFTRSCWRIITSRRHYFRLVPEHRSFVFSGMGSESACIKQVYRRNNCRSQVWVYTNNLLQKRCANYSQLELIISGCWFLEGSLCNTASVDFQSIPCLWITWLT